MATSSNGEVVSIGCNGALVLRVGGFRLNETKLLLREWDHLSVDTDGILRRHKGPRTQIIVPKKFHPLVLKELHEKMGHRGVHRTLHLARERFYWPHLQRDIEHYILD